MQSILHYCAHIRVARATCCPGMLTRRRSINRYSPRGWIEYLRSPPVAFGHPDNKLAGPPDHVHNNLKCYSGSRTPRVRVLSGSSRATGSASCALPAPRATHARVAYPGHQNCSVARNATATIAREIKLPPAPCPSLSRPAPVPVPAAAPTPRRANVRPQSRIARSR